MPFTVYTLVDNKMLTIYTLVGNQDNGVKKREKVSKHKIQSFSRFPRVVPFISVYGNLI